MRRYHARDVYQYYVDQFNLPLGDFIKDEVRDDLLKKWDKVHERLKINNPSAFSTVRKKFIKEMRDTPYLLRGENKEKAIQDGRPIKYNRLALLATSVQVLSHWWLDVTVSNYII